MRAQAFLLNSPSLTDAELLEMESRRSSVVVSPMGLVAIRGHGGELYFGIARSDGAWDSLDAGYYKYAAPLEL